MYLPGGAKLREKEEILEIVRRCDLSLIKMWVLFFLFTTLPFFLLFWLLARGWWGKSIFIFLILSGIIFLLEILNLKNKKVLVITNQRIIDINRGGLFNKIIVNLGYNEIDRVIGEISGFWGTIGKYGNLKIYFSSKYQIEIKFVKNPIDLQQLINEQREHDRSAIKSNLRRGDSHLILDKLEEMELKELCVIKKKVDERVSRLRDYL